jgi:hypothetical protein
MFGVDPKKLVKERHVSLEKISTMFGPKKANGYRSSNLDLTPEVEKRAKKLYFKFYPTNEKIINIEFGHKLCWGIVANMHIAVNWTLLGLNITKEKAQKVKGPQVDLGRVGVEEKGAIAKIKGTTQNQNPKKLFQGLNVMANHSRRPWSFITNEIFGVEELCELKKVELIVAKSIISNVLQLKIELEAKVKHFAFSNGR